MSESWDWLKDLSKRHNDCCCVNVIYDDEFDKLVSCIKVLREALKFAASHSIPTSMDVEEEELNRRGSMARTDIQKRARESLAKCAAGEFE